MEITSIQFFIMVGVSLLIYWQVPHRYQWMLLLADSLVFYFANAAWYTVIYVCISVGSTWAATRYFAQAGGDEAESQKKKNCVLAGTILLNVGILAVLKYANLAIHTFNFLGERFLHIRGISDVAWLAPLAISYYTLQLIAYTVDCAAGAEPFDNPLKLALYTIYFPLMTNGPICRRHDLGDRLFAEHRFAYDRVRFGLYRIGWGLFKKMVISNRMAVIVDQLWEQPDKATGLYVWISAVLFVLQLYTDFSGCIDIALGVSECFGIILPENFNAPFFARSVQEFWQRWHITLGAWLKEYVMFPLCRTNVFKRWSRKLKKKWGRSGQQIPYYVAMFVVWTLMGIWHGSSWKYVVGEGWLFWALIVLGQVLEPLTKKAKSLLHLQDSNPVFAAFQMVRTSLLFCAGNIAFRAVSLQDTFRRIAGGVRLRLGLGTVVHTIMDTVSFGGMGSQFGFLLMVLALLAVLVVDFLKYRGVNVREKLAACKWRWVLYYALVVLLYASLDIANQESLYAQF